MGYTLFNCLSRVYTDGLWKGQFHLLCVPNMSSIWVVLKLKTNTRFVTICVCMYVEGVGTSSMHIHLSMPVRYEGRWEAEARITRNSEQMQMFLHIQNEKAVFLIFDMEVTEVYLCSF